MFKKPNRIVLAERNLAAAREARSVLADRRRTMLTLLHTRSVADASTVTVAELERVEVELADAAEAVSDARGELDRVRAKYAPDFMAEAKPAAMAAIARIEATLAAMAEPLATLKAVQDFAEANGLPVPRAAEKGRRIAALVAEVRHEVTAE